MTFSDPEYISVGIIGGQSEHMLAFDENFLGIGGRAEAVGVETFDDEIEGGGTDRLQIAVDAGPGFHFVFGPIEIGKADVFGNAEAGLGKPAFDGELVN